MSANDGAAIDPPEMVAVLPAAGRARRLGRIPCSKEILPVPAPAGSKRAFTTGIERALSAAARAGATEAAIVIAAHKSDIPAYVGDGTSLGLPLTYLEANDSRSCPDTVARAAGWADGRDILLLFPDILWEPTRLLIELAALRRDSDLAMALVPSDRGDKVDLVDLDASGRVRGLVMKPGPGRAGLTWTAARWSARFTDFLVSRVRNVHGGLEDDAHIGHVMAGALGAGLPARGILAPDGAAADVGTPQDYVLAWTRLPAADRQALGREQLGTGIRDRHHGK